MMTENGGKRPQRSSANAGDPELREEFNRQAGRSEGEALSPGVPKTRYDLRILRGLRQIIRAIDIHSRKLAAKHHVTGPQLCCLMTIAENGPTTATAIAQDVYLSASTVVGILDRLQEKGLVQRERDSKDRRLVFVTVTEKGRELVASAPSPLQDKLAEALKDLPELEQTTIALSLDRIVELMEARVLPAAPLLETGSIEQVAEGKVPDLAENEE
jgi:DNA-binding MarR family transcriptional regulator